MRHFYLLLFLGICPALWAADLPGSQDLEVLPRYPRAEIVDYRESALEEKRYPQADLRRISGRLRVSAEVLAEGHLRALTYQLPDGHSPRDALATARQQLQKQGAHLLFWCEGRDCGSSSLWANQIFGKAQLYGPEDRQSYQLLRLAEPQQDSLIALYGITRGNHRSYLHVEQLDAQMPLGQLLPTPETLLRLLRLDGELVFPRLDAVDEQWSHLLADTMNLDRTLHLRLMGSQAADWQRALENLGIRANRLQLGESSGTGLRLQLR